jgi:hypothetical protein
MQQELKIKAVIGFNGNPLVVSRDRFETLLTFF